MNIGKPMRSAAVATAVIIALAFVAARFVEERPAFATTLRLPAAEQETPSGGRLTSFQVGHEYRQDDWPSMAAAPDGSMWVAWLSFGGERDDVAIRRYRDGKWSNLLWVPATSGDSWMPQVFTDPASRVWVVWSQQVSGNWDLYARRFDPARQEWSSAERLTWDPLPDIHPRLWSDGQGKAALVWQAFRRREGGGASSNVFLRMFDGETWLPETRVTDRAASDWEPSVSVDSGGAAWVAYDSYRNGNYDVFLAKVSGGKVEEVPVAVSPRFEARATVTVDTADRVWVAWEAGPANWGKDQGYIVQKSRAGSLLGGLREVRVRCYQNGQWREPSVPSFDGGSASQPYILSDGQGSVWLAANVGAPPPYEPPQRLPDGYQPRNRRVAYGYRLTRYDGGAWSPPFPLAASGGRLSTRISGARSSDGDLWLAWPLDGRDGKNPTKPQRQEIRAGTLPAPPAPASLALASPAPERVEAQVVHPNENADLAAIRGYTTQVQGRRSRLLRGDFHRHTELSWDIGGSIDGSLMDFYRYMIDAAGMDFGASTDHQAGAWPYWWWYTQKLTDMHHVPGAYVAIFGYERSAQYPFGHRNILFVKRSDWRVTPFFMRQGAAVDEPPVGTPLLVANDTELLHEEMRGRNAVAIPHTSGNRMGTDWHRVDAELDPVAEIFQGCRTSFEQVGAPYVADPVKDAAHIKVNGYQPQGMLSQAWAKGYKLGVIASSDHFSTHISYALVYTHDLTRQGILDAIRKRHTYGATDNIVLEVRSGEHFMGDEFRASRPVPLRVKARGTAPVERVDVVRDSQVIYTASPGRRDVQFDYTDRSGAGARHYYYVRLLQQDGMMAWSSPMFVNY